MNRIIGIDLGTSTSEVSYIIDGNPVVIPNLQGKKVTPSVVHITQDGDVLVGDEAAEFLLTRPDCTFMEIKRKTGSDEKLIAHGKEYTPEDLQCILIKYLIKSAENFLDEKINRVVITVPAYFNDIQRRATAKAGELAGLNVERILNEPTAAALDYGLQNLSECKNILIYDFGGGTLDITVLELFEGVIDVKASSGNNHLGGKDIDEIIMRNLIDVKGDMRALMRLKKAAEECKIALSESDSYDVSLPFLLTGKNGKPLSVEKTITRADFEKWISELVTSTRDPIMSALSDAQLNPEDLDIVLLVGGSTRIPCVRRMVAETLGQEPKSLVDPDLTVARGAAIQGAIIEGIFDNERSLVLMDVCPYTLGVESMSHGTFEDKLMFSPIIPRNTTIPSERSEIYRTYQDYQSQVLIKVYQGESQNLDNNEYLGELMLSGLPAVKSDKSRIEVTFAYDVNGILQVKAKSLLNGNDVSAVINTAGVKPRPVLDLTKWEQAEGAKKVRPAIRKAEKYISSGDMGADELEVLIVRIKEALLTGDQEQAESLREELIDMMKLIDSWK